MHTLDSILDDLRSRLPASLRGAYLDSYVQRRRTPMELLLARSLPGVGTSATTFEDARSEIYALKMPQWVANRYLSEIEQALAVGEDTREVVERAKAWMATSIPAVEADACHVCSETGKKSCTACGTEIVPYGAHGIACPKCAEQEIAAIDRGQSFAHGGSHITTTLHDVFEPDEPRSSAAKAAAMEPIDRFMAAYEPALYEALRKHPEEFAYTADEVPGFLPRWRQTLLTEDFNHDGYAMRGACKRLGIKCTKQALIAFLRPKTPERPRLPSPDEMPSRWMSGDHVVGPNGENGTIVRLEDRGEYGWHLKLDRPLGAHWQSAAGFRRVSEQSHEPPPVPPESPETPPEPLDDIPEPKLGDKVPTPPKPPRGEPPWRPTWATNADGRMPVWALPPTDGLAIQITPHQASKRSKIEWRLAILHLGTGFTVVSRRAGYGDTDIDWSIDNFRRMQGLLTDLLAIGSWEIELTPDVIAARMPLIRAAMARHVPAIPEWRAWRSKHTKREAKEQALDHRWFTDEQEAMEWAQGADWWLVEQWVTPPLYRNYDNGNIARYIDGVFPAGCVRATWGGHGWQRSSSPGVMASAMPSPPVDHQADVDMLKAHSWEDARWEKRTPTGDLPPRLLSLLNNGMLRLVDDYFCPSIAAMRQMLRARRREKVTPLTSTCKAYSEWKSLQKKALQGRSGELARGGAEHMSARFSALCHLAACIDRDSVPPLPHWDRGWIGHRPSTTQVLSYEDGIACIEMTGYSVKNVWVTFETEPCVPWAPNSALTVKRYPSLERGYTDLFDTTLEEHSSRHGAEQYATRLREAVRFAGPRRRGPAAPIAKMLAKRQADELAARELEEAGREPPPEPFLIFMGPQGRSAKPLSELRVLLDAENPGAWEEAQANVAIYDDPIGDLGRWYAHDHGLTYEGVESLGVRFSRWESDEAERGHLRRVAPDTYARLVSVDRLHRGQTT